MNLVEATGLIPGGLDLQPSGGGIGDSDGVPGFSGFPPALRQPQRIPANPQPVQGDQAQGQCRPDEHGPAPGRQSAQPRQPPHGNTRRSSSKWGPSRRRVQSPPQMIAVPWRAAAALNAAAIRGYSGQSQRT